VSGALMWLATPRMHAELRAVLSRPLSPRWDRARELAPRFEQAVHALKGTRPIIDIRNFGLMAGIELEPLPGKPGARGYQAFLRCLEKGLLVRVTGDIIALSPPLIISAAQIDEIAATLGSVLRELA